MTDQRRHVRRRQTRARTSPAPGRVQLSPRRGAGVRGAIAAAAVAGLVAGAAQAATPGLFSIAAHDVPPQTRCNLNTTVGIESCLEQRLLALDRRIDATAAQILRLEQRPGTAPAAISHLNGAQRAFLAYRHADCLSAADVNAGGTLANVDFGECELRDSTARLAQLQRQYKLLEPR